MHTIIREKNSRGHPQITDIKVTNLATPSHRGSKTSLQFNKLAFCSAFQNSSAVTGSLVLSLPTQSSSHLFWILNKRTHIVTSIINAFQNQEILKLKTPQHGKPEKHSQSKVYGNFHRKNPVRPHIFGAKRAHGKIIILANAP